MDRYLKPFLSWGMLLISLALFGPLAALYFVFCWFVTALIDRNILRKEREETYAHQGLPEDEIDSLLLPRDRIVRIVRSLFAFGAAALFHFYA
ncbi:hypothetical protein [Nevskia sp.]|uniref:hypothetical protein n=1 Tax=Nevskia sp. TaxID=1929292 RepID=UPI0025D9786A|nr:hypothetical protein [Nevskia sp.]HET7797243.1 hypothetical protein [Nevskia sp.]